MQFNSDYDASSSEENEKKRSGFTSFNKKAAIAIYGLTAVLAIGAIGYFAYQHFGSNNVNKLQDPKLSLYRTIGVAELRVSPSNSANVIANLKEGTNVSGKSAGNADGVAWLEVMAVDGTKGFLQATSVAQIGTDVDLSQVKYGISNVVTSSTVNLRAIPSLTGQVVGTADGGTRLISDGSIVSQGEQWLRLRLGKDVTAYVMARFTTPDEDSTDASKAAGSEVGVMGIVSVPTNVQATPFDNSRIIRPLLMNDQLSIIGQTQSGEWWYIVRLADGTQGFVLKSTITIPTTQNKWVYSDGTVAEGPKVPKPEKNKPNSASTKAATASAEPVTVDLNSETPAAEKPAAVAPNIESAPKPAAPKPAPKPTDTQTNKTN